MFKPILYKEWLKIRWAVYVVSALFLVALIYIFATVNYTYRFTDASSYWYNIIFRGITFYGKLSYLPLLAGLVVATVQFVPEIQRKRIKLTFHLPVDEYNVLLLMSGIGAGILTAIFALFYLLFALSAYYFFPAEIANSALLTIMPRFLLGLAAYFMVAYIIMEPLWMRRVFYIVLSVGFGKLFLGGWYYNIYDRVLFIYVLFAIFMSVSIIFPGHRFKKGF